MNNLTNPEGILLVDKPKGKTSFSLISVLRKILSVQKIGHAGTLDPMATGLMILLVGKKFTTQSDSFLVSEKEYVAEIHLGITTDSYDAEGTITSNSSHIPTHQDLLNALNQFQGKVEQIPPMFSAKKIGGKKLYSLARQGIEIERAPVLVELTTTLLNYNYPKIQLHVHCSKGTYIRSIAHDLGKLLECGAHLSGLRRTRSGKFHIDNSLAGDLLFTEELSSAKLKVINHLQNL